MSRAKIIDFSSKVVRETLDRLGKTQVELAEYIGMKSPTSLSHALLKQTIAVRKFDKMCEFLDCDPLYLRGYREYNRGFHPDSSFKEATPHFMVLSDDDDIPLDFYVWSKPNTYASIGTIIALACRSGFKDRIQEILDRESSTTQGGESSV